MDILHPPCEACLVHPDQHTLNAFLHPLSFHPYSQEKQKHGLTWRLNLDLQATEAAESPDFQASR